MTESQYWQVILTVIQTVILFVGLAATFFTLHRHHKDSKALATINLIIHQRSNDKLNKAIDLMSKLANKKTDFSDLSEYFKNKDSEECNALRTVLNFREFVAVGINNDSIDEHIYKDAYYSTVLRDWKYLKNTIYAIRESSTGFSTAFQEFEKLVLRWQKHPLKKKI